MPYGYAKPAGFARGTGSASLGASADPPAMAESTCSECLLKTQRAPEDVSSGARYMLAIADDSGAYFRFKMRVE